MSTESYQKRQLFIGDVHGCYDELMELLDKLDYRPKRDKLYFVGDLINKGPKSLEVLKWVKKHSPQVVLGNHEYYFLRYCRGITNKYSQNFEDLKDQLGKDLETWLEFIESWPLYIEEKDFILVHGGLIPGEDPKNSDPEILTNIRTWDGQGVDLKNPENPPWHQLYKGHKLVIYGHWAKQGLFETPRSIGLDSGCVYGGSLSALVLPQKVIVQVKAHDSYISIPQQDK